MKIRAYRRLSEMVSGCRKSVAMMPWAWAVRNWRQVGPERCGGGVDAGCVEDLPDCGRGDRVAEAGEFALYPAVASAAVLLGRAQDELFTDFGSSG
jgi:hypothetical protein